VEKETIIRIGAGDGEPEGHSLVQIWNKFGQIWNYSDTESPFFSPL